MAQNLNIGRSIFPNILVENILADANSNPLFLMHTLSCEFRTITAILSQFYTFVYWGQDKRVF